MQKSVCPLPHLCVIYLYRVFFFNDTATTEIYTLSLHDALPISTPRTPCAKRAFVHVRHVQKPPRRSEEHTSELQSPMYLVCRLLLEKNKTYSRETHGREAETSEFPCCPHALSC